MVGEVERLRPEFDAFYRAQFPAIVVLVERLLAGVEPAEDIAQEAMSKAYSMWDDVAVHENPEAWVRRVAINLALSGHRRAGRRRRSAERLAAAPPAAEPRAIDDDDSRITAALGALPMKQRAAVTLHYLEDRPTDEIAELLGCADSTARVHLHRGRKALFAALGASTPEEVW